MCHHAVRCRQWDVTRELYHNLQHDIVLEKKMRLSRWWCEQGWVCVATAMQVSTVHGAVCKTIGVHGQERRMME
jgi:hypothetical protein